MSEIMSRSIMLAVALTGAGLAATAAAAEAAAEEELDEVVVLGQQPARNPRALAAWLSRLPGRYRSEGTLSSRNRPAVPATGTLVCTAVGTGPGVQCVMHLTTSATDTRLNPGAMLLGLDIERPLIRYMTVDDQGVAAGDAGELRGDTVRFRTPCVATGVTHCFTHTWINAAPNSNQVHLRVDIELDGRVSSSFNIAHSRVRPVL